MRFPIIEKLEDLTAFVKDKKEIHVRETDDGFTTVIYRFMDSHTFDSYESLEARGIMFDDLGNVISRPLHKFHNLDATHSGINSYTREYILANKDQVRAIYVKLDGSMISTANYQGTVRLRSKSAFDTDVCKIAQALYDASETIQEFCNFVVHNLNCTATFELTSPESRIVLNYPDSRLRLLHVRHNVTGEYLTHRIDNVLEKCPQVPLDQLETILSDEHLESLTDTEGYVIQFKDGDMVKIKCPWYVALHKSVTFVRERDIAELVLDERLDDTYEAFKQLGINEEKIAAIETAIKNQLISIENEVTKIHNITKDMERKEVALQWKNWGMFPLLMQMRDGKEPRTVDFYRKHYLKNWPLTAVDNVGEKND